MAKTRVAVFHVAFDPEFMIDQDTLNDIYGGDWKNFFIYMIREEGLTGIFDDKDFKLIEVKEAHQLN